MNVSGQLHARFPPGDGASYTNWIGRWVGPRAGLDAVKTRKTSCPCREYNYNFTVLRPAVTILTELFCL
jgi:hypothetical protein